ncbi:alpha-mannosyltransferase [Pleomorphomonas diazotrophica]|uniref:Alpha-mannosyltransferase n=1 Tax=Pleomorphomonas diazotrophica TaxID=1166257 RepID=A0A1I4R8C9_9HYPH|nr:glycosyltransferase family 1 protein [Pleomorphomonas diazotrophica]PKR90140.1 alpha-mannosyltransferase [Pleomorphomonas diazotrophica]SFM48200.1 Glycosyltransferase involved in cell wall bisynthesis [Pleomorphomonas diazotrophica]
MTRITVVTDAWHPQVNGVVRSIERTNAELIAMGAEVTMVTPDLFRTIPLPSYPEIRVAISTYRRVAREIERGQPSYVHIATEGPLGLKARKWCRRNGMPYTTSYHTRFPEYVAARLPVPESWLYALVRRFHNGGAGCMVATDTLAAELSARGFRNLMRWGRGIDADLFRPRPAEPGMFDHLPRPIFINVGRVAVEKNLEAFLALDLPGSKVVVGDGPQRASLEKRYPQVHFAGIMIGEELARAYASADVFVFPSRTDTFGNVLLEALASGLPVAAYPVMGPLDILGDSDAGILDEDLRAACLGALEIDPAAARELALSFSWRRAAKQFLDNVRLANGETLDEAPLAPATA